MIRRSDLKSRQRRAGGWRRRLAIAAALLLAVLAGAVVALTRPVVLTPLATALIERFGAVDAAIDRASVSLDGKIHLRGVELRLVDTPGRTAEAGRLFQAQHLAIEPDFSALLRGRVAAESIVLLRPTLYVTEDLHAGRFTFAALWDDGEGESEPANLPQRLPEVFIRGGVLQFGQLGAGGYRPMGELALTGTLTASAQRPGEYAFVLREQGSGSAGPDEGGAHNQPPPTLRGSLDLRHLRARATLEHFALRRAQRNLLPRRLRQWWDRLRPHASLPTLELAYDSDPAVGLQARLVIEDGSLSLPYGAFAPRMTDVSGQFRVERDDILIENLTGRVQGIRYHIDGRIHGFEADAPFKLHVRTEQFEIAHNPFYAALLPPKIREHYNRFSPSGIFTIEATLSRTEPGGRIGYAGALRVIQGRGVYEKFPYPMREVSGLVRFTDERVEVVKLVGRGLSGATVTVHGTITPPGEGAAVRMQVVARNVPVDRYLMGAMEPEQRAVCRVFMHEPSYQALLNKGLVRAATPLTADPGDAAPGATSDPDADATQSQATAPAHDAELAVPVFELGGTVDATVRISREYGDDKKYRVTATVHPNHTAMLLKHWPYPVRWEAGTVVIGPDRVLVQNVQVSGLTGAGGVIDGVVELPEGERDMMPRLELRDLHLPVDRLLLASMPSPQDEWIKRLGLTGTLVGDGRVFRDQTGPNAGRIDFSVTTGLDDATATPLGDAMVFGDFTGSATISRSELTLDQFAARDGQASLAVSGRLDWSADHLEADLRISGRNLLLSDGLTDAIPLEAATRSRVDALMQAYHPTGVFHAELDYQSGMNRPVDAQADQATQTFTLTLEPLELALNIDGESVVLPRMTGLVVARPGELELREVGTTMAHGSATVSGGLALGANPRMSLRLTAQGQRLGTTARALLPASVRAAVNRLGLDGGYHLAGRLVREPTADGRQQTRFNAQVQLRDAVADVGVAVSELDGTLTVASIRQPDWDWPQLDLTLEAQSVRIAQRRVAPLTLRFATGQRPDMLKLTEMHGAIYGGTLVGQGSIQLGDPGRYQFDFTLQDVNVEPMIDPPAPSIADARAASAPAKGGAVPATVRSPSGKLSASLAIQALLGNPASRSGRGALQIRDARLYERPLSLAILQAANLSLPAHGAFDRASAQYIVDGPTIRFDSIRLASPTIAVVGSGTMDFATTQLDLTLVTRNPGALELGAIGDILNVLKDELIAIHITGPLASPRSRLTSFEGIRASWDEVFGGSPAPTPREASASDLR